MGRKVESSKISSFPPSPSSPASVSTEVLASSSNVDVIKASMLSSSSEEAAACSEITISFEPILPSGKGFSESEEKSAAEASSFSSVYPTSSAPKGITFSVKEKRLGVVKLSLSSCEEEALISPASPRRLMDTPSFIPRECTSATASDCAVSCTEFSPCAPPNAPKTSTTNKRLTLFCANRGTRGEQ